MHFPGNSQTGNPLSFRLVTIIDVMDSSSIFEVKLQTDVASSTSVKRTVLSWAPENILNTKSDVQRSEHRSELQMNLSIRADSWRVVFWNSSSKNSGFDTLH